MSLNTTFPLLMLSPVASSIFALNVTVWPGFAVIVCLSRVRVTVPWLMSRTSVALLLASEYLSVPLYTASTYVVSFIHTSCTL